ncbi:MAG TPA: hypothetical protein DIW36_07570, partial [Ruminococcaceae bacterium]|nr:hypothetical protein [Oscillospiraceae bacterium]
MPDSLIYIILILLIAVFAVMIYTLFQIKKLKDEEKNSETDKQLAAILTLMKQSYGSNAEEFER